MVKNDHQSLVLATGVIESIVRCRRDVGVFSGQHQHSVVWGTDGLAFWNINRKSTK